MKRFLEHRFFTAYELITPEGWDRAEAYLARARNLIGRLETPEIKQAQKAFSEMLGNILSHYDVGDRTDVKELLADEAELSFLWRDALAAMLDEDDQHIYHDLNARLHLTQFFRGPADPRPPVFLRYIYEFKELHDVVLATAGMPRSGVMLFLVKEIVTNTSQNGLPYTDNKSFFGFAIKPAVRALRRGEPRRYLVQVPELRLSRTRRCSGSVEH